MKTLNILNNRFSHLVGERDSSLDRVNKLFQEYIKEDKEVSKRDISEALRRLQEVKQSLRESEYFHEGLEAMLAVNNGASNRNGDLVWSFLLYDYNDVAISKALDKALNRNEETDIHQLVASMSYSLPTYGVKWSHKYHEEVGKLVLASTIMKQYQSIYGGRVETKKSWNSHGKEVFKTIVSLKAFDHKAVEKNELIGVHLEPGKVITKHVKVKPGSPSLRLNKPLKEVARIMSSMKLRLATDISREDVLRWQLEGKDYLQANKKYKASKLGSKAYNGEHPRFMEKRFVKYAEYFEMLQTQGMLSPLYLSVYFDYRGRIYYDLKNTLLNPQAKLGKFLWEAYNARELSEDDYRELAFVIVSMIDGKCTPTAGYNKFEANKEFFMNTLLEYGEEGTLDRVYAIRLHKAILDYENGVPSRFLVMEDFSNGGYIHFATGYSRKEEDLVNANMLKYRDMKDMHTAIQTAVREDIGIEMSRDDIKKTLSQSILAGVSVKSATSRLNKYITGKGIDIDVTEEQVAKVIMDSYGETGFALHEFNKWGRMLHNNSNVALKWVMPDGVKAMSSAFIEGQEVSFYFPVAKGGSKQYHASQMTIFRDMPIIFEASSNKPIINGDWYDERNEKQMGARAKLSGFLANTTHSVDSYVLREVIRAMGKVGAVGIFVHDNIITFGSIHRRVVKPIVQDVIINNFDTQILVDIQKQVLNNRDTSYGANPELVSFVEGEAMNIEDFRVAISDKFMQA